MMDLMLIKWYQELKQGIVGVNVVEIQNKSYGLVYGGIEKQVNAIVKNPSKSMSHP